MSEGAVSAPGWYGKLPALGDFAARRLPRSFTQPWDQWLQEGMQASRAALGEAWLEAFLHAPIQRFLVAPGILDAACWAGVLAPSVDRVGRHYPLTIAAAVHALPESRWFDALEEAVLGALDLAANVDELESALAAIGPPGGTEAHAMHSLWWYGEDLAGAQSHPGLPPAQSLLALAGVSSRA